jgi:hypothetical protein
MQMLDDSKERSRLLANYSSHAREHADAVARLRFANENSFLEASAAVDTARAACEQARLLFEEHLAKSRNSPEPDV